MRSLFFLRRLPLSSVICLGVAPDKDHRHAHPFVACSDQATYCLLDGVYPEAYLELVNHEGERVWGGKLNTRRI